MSNLSYFMTDNITDPRKEGYPLFGVGFGTGNNIQSFRIFNSNFQCVGSPYTSIQNTTTGYRHGMAIDQFYMYSLSDYSDGQGILSSQAANSSDYTQSIYQNDQYPQSLYNNCSPLGYRRGVNMVVGSYLSYGLMGQGKYLIKQILPEGVRPRRFFTINGNTMKESFSLNTLQGTEDSIDLAPYRPVGFTSNTDCYGSACYNENTKTLVISFGTTSTSTQINVFRSTVDLNSCTSLQQFFAAATATGFTVTRTNYNATENRYNRGMVLGNNDYVFMSYRNGGNGQVGDLIDLTAGTLTNVSTINNTTSYGGFDSYYIRMQTTWDNKWAFLFTSYYYYGCGVSAHVVSTTDPRRFFVFNPTDSSGGGALLPIGKEGMAYFNGVNTDSAGVYATLIDFNLTSTTGTAATVISTTGGGLSIAAINNAAAINPARGFLYMHGGYYSTCYPRFFTINWWPVDGKFNFEGTVR